MGKLIDESGIPLDAEQRIIAWCVYCKKPIYKGTKYVVDENEDKLHKYCDKLVSDNTDYLGIGE